MGEYMFSDYDLYGEEYVQAHLDLLREGYEPNPLLEVTYTVLTEGGEETRSIRAEAAYEVWIGARYDLKDPAEDFFHYFLNGQTLSGEGAHLEKNVMFSSEGILFAYAYVIPRPASCPEQGTAELSVTRRLSSYPEITRTDVKTIEYGE